MVYLDDKPILLVCDNTVFVKSLPETAVLLADAELGTPYDGAREHYLLDIENAALLDALIPVLAACTPLPKPRKKKSQNLIPDAAQMRGTRFLSSVYVRVYLRFLLRRILTV